MDDRTIRLVSEHLARTMDRRTFIKRISQALFIGAATVAAGHGLGERASAQHGGPFPPREPIPCAPFGPFCNLDGNVHDPNGCHGAHCFEHLYGGVLQCRPDYSVYQTGCWTTVTTNGYWTCCDCVCGAPGTVTCGCAQFSGTPAPQPDRADRQPTG